MTDDPDIVWDSSKGRYLAYLNMYGDRLYLGSFRSPEDAAKARTTSAWLHVQDFASHRPDSSQRYPRYD